MRSVSLGVLIIIHIIKQRILVDADANAYIHRWGPAAEIHLSRYQVLYTSFQTYNLNNSSFQILATHLIERCNFHLNEVISLGRGGHKGHQKMQSSFFLLLKANNRWPSIQQANRVKIFDQKYALWSCNFLIFCWENRKTLQEDDHFILSIKNTSKRFKLGLGLSQYQMQRQGLEA